MSYNPNYNVCADAKASGKLEAQPSRVRYFYGKSEENKIADCLEKHHGFQFKLATEEEDRKLKIDRWMLMGGQWVPVQIKFRMNYSGNDILICLFQPWHSIHDFNVGRDVMGEYEKYIVLNGDTLMVIDGAAQKELIGDINQEWFEQECPVPFFSKVHPGCEIKKHHDKWSGVPKILLFVPAHTYEPDSISYYDMIRAEHGN